MIACIVPMQWLKMTCHLLLIQPIKLQVGACMRLIVEIRTCTLSEWSFATSSDGEEAGAWHHVLQYVVCPLTMFILALSHRPVLASCMLCSLVTTNLCFSYGWLVTIGEMLMAGPGSTARLLLARTRSPSPMPQCLPTPPAHAFYVLLRRRSQVVVYDPDHPPRA
jgi:hypothetical protein